LELLFPEVDERSGTAFADRKSRLRLAHKVERTLDYAGETFDRVHEEIDKNEEGLEQREWDDRDERRRSDEHSREREEDRKDLRLVLEAKERLRALLHKDVLLTLIVVTTLAAIAFAYLAVEHRQLGYAGASVFTTALSGCGVYASRLLRWPAGASADAAATALEPRPYRWSVLDLQVEVNEEPSESGS
jgi:hypothetical protein